MLFLHPKDFNGCLVELEQVMTITAAIVVYAVTWFMMFFIVLPLRFRLAGRDAARSCRARPPGAPANEVVGRKAWITTLVATVIWAVICGDHPVGRGSRVDDLDVFGLIDRA